jgi:riboflavin kinase/FMN adenylyltransferase
VRVLTGDPMLWPHTPGGSAVTIGVYDGVHLGHQRVLEDLESAGKALGVRSSAVLIFDRHPLSVVDPSRSPKLLTTVDRRIDILGSLGVDMVGVLPFEQIRRMAPVEFIDKVLVDTLEARLVVVGSNFRFGVDRSGDVSTLRDEGARGGFEVDTVDLLRDDGATLSSTAIREMLRRGEVETAAAALGRHYELDGTVVEGDARGKTLGYPTANLSIPEEVLIPREGVYAAWATTVGRTHPAVVNIGVRPTFDGSGQVVEAYLLDVSLDLYGRAMSLRFVGRIRDEIRFESVAALVDQIGKDVAVARVMLR